MAVKFPVINPNTVRFTDYTLNGNSENIYFYFASSPLKMEIIRKNTATDPVMVKTPNLQKTNNGKL
jgi:hypothetical protein